MLSLCYSQHSSIEAYLCRFTLLQNKTKQRGKKKMILSLINITQFSKIIWFCLLLELFVSERKEFSYFKYFSVTRCTVFVPLETKPASHAWGDSDGSQTQIGEFVYCVTITFTSIKYLHLFTSWVVYLFIYFKYFLVKATIIIHRIYSQNFVSLYFWSYQYLKSLL